jgi:hypothetical protein
VKWYFNRTSEILGRKRKLIDVRPTDDNPSVQLHAKRKIRALEILDQQKV